MKSNEDILTEIRQQKEFIDDRQKELIRMQKRTKDCTYSQFINHFEAVKKIQFSITQAEHRILALYWMRDIAY